MSEAVEIAQPTGRGALTMAGRTEEERRGREWAGRVACPSQGSSVELRMALKRT